MSTPAAYRSLAAMSAAESSAQYTAFPAGRYQPVTSAGSQSIQGVSTIQDADNAQTIYEVGPADKITDPKLLVQGVCATKKLRGSPGDIEKVDSSTTSLRMSPSKSLTDNTQSSVGEMEDAFSWSAR